MIKIRKKSNFLEKNRFCSISIEIEIWVQFQSCNEVCNNISYFKKFNILYNTIFTVYINKTQILNSINL